MSGKLAKGPASAVCLVPYPDIPAHDKEAIEQAIWVAWTRLLARTDIKTLKSLKEVPLNELLRMELNDLLDEEPSPVPAYTSERFETVQRDAELCDYTGEHLQKKPDLMFRHAGPKHPGVIRREQHGLFVECKIMDPADKVHDLDFYSNTGLGRFVRGEYAWAMLSAMMVAYVRDVSTVPVHLNAHLSAPVTKKDFLVESLPVRCPRVQQQGCPNIYETVHGRDFDVGGSSPGSITISHFWLPLA